MANRAPPTSELFAIEAFGDSSVTPQPGSGRIDLPLSNSRCQCVLGGQKCPPYLIKASAQREQPVLALPTQEWLKVLPQRKVEPGLAKVPQELVLPVSGPLGQELAQMPE